MEAERDSTASACYSAVEGLGIETRSLTFCYPSQPSRPVLHQVSITVKPNELVAFVGKSGSGKSTLLAIISGLYHCAEGQVVVGGCDLSNTHLLVKQKVRNCNIMYDSTMHSFQIRQVGVVEQSSGLFSGTVVENICYGKV